VRLLTHSQQQVLKTSSHLRKTSDAPCQVSAAIGHPGTFDKPKFLLAQVPTCLNNFEMRILSNGETAELKCYFI